MTTAAPARSRGKTAMTARRRDARDAASRLAERSIAHTLAANPLVGVRGRDVVATAASLLQQLGRKPQVVSRNYAKLLAESARIATGRSQLAAAPGDKRFADPAWGGNAMFRRVLQSYVALCGSLDRCVDEAKLDPRSTERARFVMSLLEDALAPTNFMASNPAALRKLVDSKGTSLLRGAANLVEDVFSGTGLPRQVDKRPFTLGRTLAATPGAVVFRNELLELIQYTPATADVHARPLLIVPPQINKYYVFDLGSSQSLVRWTRDAGLQTFAVSWRNPTRAQAAWGLDAYVEALEQAVDAVREITSARDVNVLGACSGAITLSALLGYLAAVGKRKVHSATIAVCVLDMADVRDSAAGLFVTPSTVAAAKAASRKRGVVDGAELARMFAWMRPNDLVWNYVVNNYLLGNEPPAHEILYWSNDATRLPAKLHADFLDLVAANPFPQAGQLRVRGKRIDLGKLGLDAYVVGGLTDHITPWQGVYRTARLYGARRSTFVLASSGHVQSLVNPPGNKKAWFMTATAQAATSQAWLARREKIEGSWWPHWRDWLRARSGGSTKAPAALGSALLPPLVAAPGTYVLER